MPSELVECVPNFSEGRDRERLETILAAVRAVPGATVLDVEADADHNRSVVTIAGTRQAVAEAAVAAARQAAAVIDLNAHRGEHPRMGAVDVIPFVPLEGVTMADCVELARAVGTRIGAELGIPVYLYEEAATRPERRNLAEVRKGEFEGLRDAIGKDPARAPDFGPARIHPTAGAVAVGARTFLIAYNVNLATADLDVAQQLAQLFSLNAIAAGLGSLPSQTIHLPLDLRNDVRYAAEICARGFQARFGGALPNPELRNTRGLFDDRAAVHGLGRQNLADATLLDNGVVAA